MSQETIAVSVEGQTAKITLVTPEAMLGLKSEQKIPGPCLPLCSPTACLPGILPLPKPCLPDLMPKPPKPT